ncbi:DUF6132 family protein [Bacteroidota bacterium]
MKKLIHKYSVQIISVIIGGILGYLYWYKIGCQSGTCPITSVWYNTAIYGGILGYLTGDSIKSMIDKNKSKKNETNEHNFNK